MINIRLISMGSRSRILMVLAVVAVSGLMLFTMLRLSEAAEIPGKCDSLDCTQRFVEAPNGVKLAVKEFGDPTGPTIILIHGLSQSHLSWKLQFKHLSNKGYRVIAWDYPGHGDSDRPTDLEFYSEPEVWAGYVQAIIDDINVREACLVGHSLGGMIIDDYIFEKGTEHIAGVVYSGGSHRYDVGFFQGSDDFLAIAPQLTDPELSVRLQGTSAFAGLLTFRPMSPEEVLEFSMYNMSVAREAIGGLFAYVFAEKPEGYDKKVLRSLATVPVILIHGREDAIVPYEVSEVSQKLIQDISGGNADVESVAMNNVGHAPQFEAPREFNRIVDQFCGDQLRAG